MMSFDSLNSNNDQNGTFSNKKDEETRKNFNETLASTQKSSEESPSSITVKIMEKQKKKTQKQSYTFSLTPEQMDKFNTLARKKGYKGRSDFLSAIIDGLQ